MTDRFKSRKWLLCVLIVLIATGMLLLTKISADIFYQLVRDVVWGYVAGNVGATAANALNKKGPEGPAAGS